jgi:hypothetical protein
MPYHAYENWTAARPIRATVHESSCPYCNYGKGIHAGANARHGKWHGPFSTVEAAHTAAEHLRTQIDVRCCKHCAPC